MVEIMKTDDELVKDITDFVKDKDTEQKPLHERQDADYKMWAQEPFEIDKSKGSYRSVTVSTPRTFSDKLTEELANAELTVTIPLFGDKEKRDEDAYTERFIYGILDMINDNSIAVGEPLPKGLMAWHVNNRGINVLRYFMYEDDDEIIPDLAVWDGRHVRWEFGRRRLKRVVRLRWDSAQSLADMYGDDKLKIHADKKGQLTVYNQWDEYREVVVVEKTVVKNDPHNLKRVPVGIFPAGHTPIIQTPDGGGQEIANWAESCFARGRHIWPLESEVLSYDLTQVAKATHTPKKNKFDSRLTGGHPEPVNLDDNPDAIGADIIIDTGKGQDIESMPLPPTSPVLPHLYQALREMDTRATAPDVLWGSLPTQATAQGTAMLIREALTALKTGKLNIEHCYSWLGSEIVRQFKDGDFGELKVRGYQGKDKSFAVTGKGEKLTTDKKIVAELVIDLPQDELQNADIAATLVDRELMSPERAMDKHLHIEDVDEELRKIARGRVRKNVGLSLLDEIDALIKDDPKGNLEKIVFLQSMLDKMIQQLMAQMSGAPPPGAPGGGVPGAPQPPRPAQDGLMPANRGVMGRMAGKVSNFMRGRNAGTPK